MNIKSYIYYKATHIYDYNLPIISWLMDKLRDWCMKDNEELWYN